MSQKRFNIALTFSGNKRPFVAKVAAQLAKHFGEEKILYDKYHQEELALARLGRVLPALYHDQSALVVVIFCDGYGSSKWCQMEWDAVFALIQKRKEGVMLCRFGGVEVKELYDAGFLDLDGMNSSDVAQSIIKRYKIHAEASPNPASPTGVDAMRDTSRQGERDSKKPGAGKSGPTANSTRKSILFAQRSISLLHVANDLKLAKPLYDLITKCHFSENVRLVIPAQVKSIPDSDFLVALVSPHALVDSQFRFALGTSKGKRDGSDEEHVDAILWGGGCRKSNIRDLESSFDLFEINEGGLKSFFAKLQSWGARVGGQARLSRKGNTSIQRHLDAFTSQYESLFDGPLNDSTRILHDCSQQLSDIHETHRVATHYIFATAKDLSNRLVRVVGARSIYEHDTEALNLLNEGEHYYATHPDRENPEARSSILDGTAEAYQAYVAAQQAAALRGVRVFRVYIVPSIEELRSFSRAELRREMDQLGRSGINVYVLPEKSKTIRSDLQRDFVIIADKCLGLGYPQNAPMAWSDYQIGGTDNGRAAIDVYRKYFDVLKSSPEAERFSPETSRFASAVVAREPAYSAATPTRIFKKPARRLMVVLRTNGCAYDRNNAGCTMCDFKRHAIPTSAQKLQSSDLMAQLKTVLESPEANGIDHFDMLVLGSFLDKNEIPEAFWQASLERLAKHRTLKRILIESRVPYVQRESLQKLHRWLGRGQRLEVGIGVESGNDFLRNNVLNKSLRWSDLETAVQLLASEGIGFVAYLLIKPQTLSETEALEDAIASAHRVAELAEQAGMKKGEWRLAFQPVFITRGTVLEKYMNDGMYKLVNLWTVVEVAKRTMHLTDTFVGLSDENLSDNRRPGGCISCTEAVTKALQLFNGTNDVSIFNAVKCDACLSRLDWLSRT